VSGVSARSVLLSFLLVALSASLGACGGSPAADAGNEKTSVHGRRTLDDATLAGIGSGWLEARFELDNETKEEAVQWTLSTPFVGLGSPHGPALNAHYEVAGVYGGEIFEGSGRALVLPARTVLRHDGDAQGFRGSVFGSGEAGCERALAAVQVGRLLRNRRSSSDPTTETTLVKAELDLPAFVRALEKVLRSTACGTLLRQAGAPIEQLNGLVAEVEDDFDRSEASFSIGNDKALQGVSIAIWIQTPRNEEIDGHLDVVLSRLGEVEKVVGGTAAEKLTAPNSDSDGEQRPHLEAGATLLRSLLDSLGA
jgi:hypothetical protein